MSPQRIFLWTVALVALIAALGYRTSVMREEPPKRPQLIFITGGTSPYWQWTATGARAAAKKYDANVLVLMPALDENVQQQTDILQGLDLEDVDGVAISPLDAAGQTELLRQLADKRIVVTYDSDAPDSGRQAYIGTSNFSAGRACARVVSQALPEGGKIAVLLVNSTKENLIDRKGGFDERIRQLGDDVEAGQPPKYEVVGYLEDNGDTATCEQNIKDALTANPELNCFVGMNAQHGPILLRVLEDQGKLDQIKLVTFDTSDETLDGIEEGHIYATIAQDPFDCGLKAVRLLTVLANGDEFELPIVGTQAYYSGFDVVDKEHVDEFRAALQKRQQRAEEHRNPVGPKKSA